MWSLDARVVSRSVAGTSLGLHAITAPSSSVFSALLYVSFDATGLWAVYHPSRPSVVVLLLRAWYGKTPTARLSVRYLRAVQSSIFDFGSYSQASLSMVFDRLDPLDRTRRHRRHRTFSCRQSSFNDRTSVSERAKEHINSIHTQRGQGWGTVE